jgi:TRAP-type mannitol/chloroaromatic compound transport system permease small subunit
LSHLASLARIIDVVNERIGRTIAWAALAMVVVQFTIVVMRYVFGFGSILMQESVIYLHAVLFMIGSGYTLLHDGHVRLDIFYRDASIRTKALVDLWGSIGLLIPVTVLIWWFSWPYVAASWKVLEGSRETSGIHAVFLLKTVILVFAALMFVQGISLLVRSILTLKGHEGRPEGR